jgi:hypothetical protein
MIRESGNRFSDRIVARGKIQARMFMKSLAAVVALATLPVLLSAPPAAAQAQSLFYVAPSHPNSRAGYLHSRPHHPRHSHAGIEIAAQQAPPPRIEITPRRLLYRRCKDWYVIQDRPSGRVLFPQRHCWWVRG